MTAPHDPPPCDDITPPTIGVYADIPDADYRKWDAVSKSDLDSFVNPRKPKGRNMLIGSVLHAMLLEGAIATSERYASSPEFDLRTKEGKAGFAAFEAKTGKLAIRPKEKLQIAAMYHAVRNHEDAVKIIDAEGQNEVSVIGQLEGFSVMSRARIDMVRRGCISDLKTTGERDAGAFKNSKAKFKYNVQAAYYGDLHAQVSGEGYMPFVHICVSSRPDPETDEHEVWVEEMGWDEVAYGRQHYEDLLILYERKHNEGK